MDSLFDIVMPSVFFSYDPIDKTDDPLSSKKWQVNTKSADNIIEKLQCVCLNPTNTNPKIVRETHLAMPHVGHRQHIAHISGLICQNDAITFCVKMGLFYNDSNRGVWLRYDNTGIFLEFGLRDKILSVERNDWNVGAVRSKKILEDCMNFNKGALTLVISYYQKNVIKIGFDIWGDVKFVHEFKWIDSDLVYPDRYPISYCIESEYGAQLIQLSSLFMIETNINVFDRRISINTSDKIELIPERKHIIMFIKISDDSSNEIFNIHNISINQHIDCIQFPDVLFELYKCRSLNGIQLNTSEFITVPDTHIQYVLGNDSSVLLDDFDDTPSFIGHFSNKKDMSMDFNNSCELLIHRNIYYILVASTPIKNTTISAILNLTKFYFD